MALIVQKFGGTSVGTVERIEQVAEKVKKFRDAGDDIVVVVSAMSGETNRLIDLAKQISEQPVPRELDVMVSTGEQVTIALLAMALIKRGVPAVSYTGNQVRILTDSAFTKARILQIDSQRIQRDLKAGRVVVVAGFQGVDEKGNITTLGRGGSDTTGVALAAALKADECQIYTDVDGVYTTDPRVVAKAQRLDKITFEEMLEMASLGSKVLQIRAVEFAGKYNVPLRVLHSFQEGPGTLITIDDEEESMEQPIISGIAFNRDEAKLTIRGVPDIPGIAFKILGPISAATGLSLETAGLIVTLTQPDPARRPPSAAAALAALAVTVLAACGTDTASPRAATDPVTVTALSGAPVTVPSGKPRSTLCRASIHSFSSPCA